MQRSVCTTVLAALMAMASPALVLAQASGYPNKPVKLLIAYPPGGITDIAGRAVAQKLSEEFGQPVVVENRAGAGGTIGATAAAKSPPDGYTLFIGTSATHGTNPSTYARLQYDPVKDFVPIASIASAPLVVVVHPSFPAKTIAELVAHAKANPGKVTYASTGAGGSVHLTQELFKIMTGTDIRHVPYKGSAPALTDLMGGHVDLMFDNMPSACRR